MLLFRGKVLKDDQTISSCNISSDDTVLLVVRKKPEPGISVSEDPLLEAQTPPPQASIPPLTEYSRRVFRSALRDTYQ